MLETKCQTSSAQENALTEHGEQDMRKDNFNGGKTKISIVKSV
jgi:hypothetical protein